MEQWRVVPGTDGRYEVSDLGRIRRADGSHVAQPKNAYGHHVVYISTGELRGSQYLHRLVAAAFLGQSDGRLVRHLDDDKSNNAVTNLAYGTREDNAADAARNGLVAKPLKHRAVCSNGHALSEETVYVRPEGRWVCRLCAREADRRRYANDPQRKTKRVKRQAKEQSDGTD